MDARDDVLQIGFVEVDRHALAGSGTRLTDLAAELEARLDPVSSADAQNDGWRIVRRQSGGPIVLGAPADEEGRTWRLAQVSGDSAGRVVTLHPDPQRLRPGRAERRRGLELRWPSFLADVDESETYVVDVVNAGGTRWVSSGDTFHAVGAFTKPGITEFSVSWGGLQLQNAVPLDPGDYARVIVDVESAAWSQLEPGEYDLHALLVDLDLRSSTPLRVRVSAEMIDTRRTRAHGRGQTPEERRGSFDDRIARLRARIMASSSLVAVAEAVADARTDADALGRISALLGCDDAQADAVYHSALRELHPGNAPIFERQIDNLVRMRDRV